MALPSIGEIDCHHCGDKHAQVKNTKKGHLMTYCEMCRTQTFCRDKKGDDAVRARMRPLHEEPKQEQGEENPPPVDPPKTKSSFADFLGG